MVQRVEGICSRITDPFCRGFTVAFENPSFLAIRERVIHNRASNEDMTRSMRLLSVDLLTSDFDSF